jgi:hypothetical protein
MDVAGEDELGAGLDERGEHVVSACDRLLSRSPRRSEQMVVERHDLQRSVRGPRKLFCRPVELALAHSARLVAPRAHGVQSHDQQPLGAVDRLRGLPLPLELAERAGEPRRKGPRDVVVAWNHVQGQAEAAEKPRGALVLAAPRAMGQIAGRDEQLGLEFLEQLSQRMLDRRVLARTEVEIGEVKNPRPHGRSRLYTRKRGMSDESTEIFDDLYLGLRAGGALRKQRRGEALTTEEQEALGRWQRLSTWRKVLAIGAFSLGTFGLGFTLGGLVFGRWRKA